ncbi:MAG: acyl-CoA dehydrogenase family protein [Marinobacter sp.]
MHFTHEHQELQRTAQQIIDKHINPYGDEWGAAGMYPAHDVFKRLGSAGLLGISKPVEYGGLGLDFSYEVAFTETLGTVRSLGVSSSIGAQTNMCTPALAQFGSDELRREFLAPSIAGDLVGSIGVSEETAGSDVANIKTYARRDGDDYIINGSKMWITNGAQADWICLLVNTSQENAPHRNKSMIIVPLDTKGVSVGNKLEKLGLHSSDTAPIFFDNVRVPVRNRIGEEGQGFINQMKQFQEERMWVTARSLRYLELCISDTVEYTEQRQIFGGKVLDKQVVYHKLAEMQTEIEALRSLLYRATAAYVNGDNVSKLASMAKLITGRLCMRIPTECLQFWGGQGFMAENWISHAYRDARSAAITGGANEIMLEIIAKEMGIHPASRNKR